MTDLKVVWHRIPAVLIDSTVKMLLWLNSGCPTTVLLIFFYSECEVYSKNHAAPFSKVITFHRKEPFDLQAFYSTAQDLPYSDTGIGGMCHKAYCKCMVSYPRKKKLGWSLILDPKNIHSMTQVARHSCLTVQYLQYHWLCLWANLSLISNGQRGQDAGSEVVPSPNEFPS